MRFLTLLLLFVALATMSAENQGKGHGKGHGKGNQAESSTTGASASFSTHDVQTIQQYYGAHPVSLPPGLQKKVARGKPLPPGWQKKLAPFPADVEGRLGPPCGYCGRGVVDGYGVIYDKKTAIILDVVQLAGDILR